MTPPSDIARSEPATSGAEFRDAMCLLASGVTVVTTVAQNPERLVGMTASAVCSLSLEPVPQLLVCISTALPTHNAIDDSKSFAINVLGAGQASLARRFSSPTPDRFSGVALREEWSVPVLADAIAHFVCNVSERFPGGDHSIFVGEVIGCEHKHGSKPLLYFDRQFGALEPPESVTLRNWADGGATA